VPPNPANVRMVSAKNDLIARNSSAGVSEPIMSVPRMLCALLCRAGRPNRPLPTRVCPTYHESVKQRIVAEKGSNGAGGQGQSAGISLHGSYEGVHCDSAGIVI
jgi:hypothetical protein